MAYIAPDTTIELYMNIPLDKGYAHTTHYDTPTDQYNDFQKYTKKTFSKQSYQRTGLGSMRLEVTYEEIMGYNYMIFYNTKAGKKYYAFIDGYSYVSNKVVNVYYTIDVMQTYMFDYTFRKCFVKRKHTATDVQGTNTIPEGLEIGDAYMNDNNTGKIPLGTWHYIILATTFPNGQPFSVPQIVNGIFCGLYIYDTTDTSQLSSVIQEYINQGMEDAIVSLYMGPPNENTAALESITFQRTSLGSYTPRNKKLLSYPYCYMEVNNNLGVSLDLHYEHMGALSVVDGVAKRTLKYQLYRYNFPQPIAIFSPQYNSLTNESDQNQDYELQYSVFPTCAFSGDSFKVWWAQNKNSYLASLSSINATYDTNVAVSNANFQQAYNSAQAQKQTVLNNNANSIAQATAQRNVSNQQASVSYDLASNTVGNNVRQTVSDAVSGLFSGQKAHTVANTLNGGNLAAQSALNASLQNSDLAFNSTQATNATNATNANLAYDTAIKNATLSQETSNLSALTTRNNAVRELAAKAQDATHQPSSVHGQAACDGANVRLNRAGFTFQSKCIYPEYAERVDQYFDVMGYAINALEYPTIHNRTYYTYLQTQDSNIQAIGNGIDTATKNTIDGIYNNGITTWTTLTNVGDYSLAENNKPLTGKQY